jgi:hypothetical protein
MPDGGEREAFRTADHNAGFDTRHLADRGQPRAELGLRT